jgi:EAL domain-containing protein (putative c-di-GMP-specific phosphodiesterase class I)
MTLEITESTILADPAGSMATLEKLNILGVKLSIDDFGTGYSSLGRLRDLPIDILKVDGVFAHGLANPQGSSLAGAIVELGKAVGLVVVAEGVESAEQEAALRALGCDLAQGYHLGLPVEADELALRLSVPAIG